MQQPPSGTGGTTGHPPPGGPGGPMPPGGPPPGAPSPGGGYRPGGPPPPGPWSAAPEPKRQGPKRGLVVALVVVLAVVIIGAGGAAGVWYAAEDSDSEASDERSAGEQPEALGIDDPREPTPINSPGGDGGQVGNTLLEVARNAGFTCGRGEGDGTAEVRCFLSADVRDIPTVQTVRYRILGNEVIEVAAEVAVDEPWLAIPMDDPDADADGDAGGFGQGAQHDVRDEAAKVLALIGSAAVPEGQAGAVNNALGTAMTDTTGEVSTDTFVGTVSLQRDVGRIDLRLPDDDGVSIPSGTAERALAYVTLAKVEAVAEEHGLTCERATETSTCTGDNVEAKIIFPRPKVEGVDHTIDEITLTAPADGNGPHPRLAEVGRALAAVAVEPITDPAEASAWVENCFGMSTDRAYMGGQVLACAPEVDGTVAEPRVVSHTLSIGS